MGFFSDSGPPAAGHTAVRQGRPAAATARPVACDRCHVASAKVEVITGAGSVFLCSHHHRLHRNAILAAGHQIRAGLMASL